VGAAGPGSGGGGFGVLPAGRRPRFAAEKMHKASRLFGAGEESGYLSLVSAWDDPQALVNGGKEPKGPIFDAALARALPDPLDRMQYLDTITYLPDDILTKVDRASMAVALEVRVPILDHRIGEFSWGPPGPLQDRGATGPAPGAAPDTASAASASRLPPRPPAEVWTQAEVHKVHGSRGQRTASQASG